VPLPPELDVEESHMAATMSGTFPVDTSIDSLSGEMTMTIEVAAKGSPGPNDPEVTLSMKMTRTRKMKQKPLK
jgi:hypothetical protein